MTFRSLVMMLAAAVAAAGGGPASAAPAKLVQLYVSIQGNDAWSGKLADANPGHTDGPLRTLARARDELRALRKQGALAGEATVWVRGGTYHLTETFSLTAEDSGTAAAPVTYRAYQDEKPVLVGARIVTGFKPYRGKILQCNLKGTPLQGKVFKQLFFRDTRMVMARYPNVDPKDPHQGTWAHVVEPDGKESRDRFVCTKDVIKNWTKVKYAEVCIHPSYGWAWNIIPIKSVDRDQATITLAGKTSYDLQVGDRYFVRNLLEELDSPGEWYLDRDTWTLYFWPPADLNMGEVLAPVIDTVVKLDGASHVTVRGFTIEACDGDAVQLTDCEGSMVAQSTIRNCGGWGVQVAGGHKSGSMGNDIYATGAGGVDLSGGDRKTLERGDNFATNNYIHHIAEFQKTYHTGVNISGVGNLASHNLIHDCPHQGILMGGNDNVVEYNIIHHVNLDSEDTGGVYMSSRNYTMRGNVIRYNIFHHIGGFGKANSWQPVQDGRVKFEYPHFTWGVYLDAPESGVLVYGNVFYSVPVCAMFNHQGDDNTFENNIVVDCPGFQASGAGYPDLAELSYSYIDKFKQQGILPLYLKHYPELANYRDDKQDYCSMANTKFVRNILYYTGNGGKMMRDLNQSAWGGGQLVWTWRGRKSDFSKFQFDDNCIFGPTDLPLKFSLTALPDAGKLLDWNEWRKTGQDQHSKFADPRFVDADHHDYRLRPDSPALKLGFQQIPLEKIGPYKDELRATWPIREAPGVAALGDFHTLRYFQLPGYEPVKAQELTPRQGVKRFFAKLAAGQPVTVACFAGGNHAQGGWFNTFVGSLKQHYPKSTITSVLASIDGGARGSNFSIYRFGHEVLSHHPDLIFVDFASDDGENSGGVAKVVEGIVRQAWHADPHIDLVFVYAFRLGYEKNYDKGLCPDAVSAYERVADHYGIPSINMGFRIATMARDGKLVLRATADEAKALGGKPVFTLDGVYTSPAANTLYAQTAAEDFTKLADAGLADPTAVRTAAMQKPLRRDNLEGACQIAITPAMLSGKWEREAPGAFAQHFDAIWTTHTPGAKLTFRFKGTAASIFDLMGPDTGRVRVTVDGQDKGERQQVDSWCYYQRLAALQIGSGWEDKEHTVTLELLPDPPDRSSAEAEAKRLGKYQTNAYKGVALRFGWIRVIGEGQQP